MKTLTKELWMNVPQRRAIVSIHREVEQLVAESGVQEGLVLVNAMHITASVFINDDESGLHHDYDKWLAIAKETSYKEFSSVEGGQALIDKALAVE